MRGKATYFFATREDMILILRDLSRHLDLTFTKCDVYASEADVEIYDTLENYENLGIAKTGDHMNCYHFLVMEKGMEYIYHIYSKYNSSSVL